MTEEQIKHIAGAVGSGLVVFVNKIENTISEVSEMDYEDYKEHFDDYNEKHLLIDKMEKNPNVLKIKKRAPKEYMVLVKAFIGMIEDEDLRKKLSLMIDRKKGMANFRDELEYDDAIRRAWFDFKAVKGYERIESLLKAG